MCCFTIKRGECIKPLCGPDIPFNVQPLEFIISLYKNQKSSIGFYHAIKDWLQQYADSKSLRLIVNEYDNRVLCRNQIVTPSILNGIDIRPYQETAIKRIIDDKISFTEICTHC